MGMWYGKLVPQSTSGVNSLSNSQVIALTQQVSGRMFSGSPVVFIWVSMGEGICFSVAGARAICQAENESREK